MSTSVWSYSHVELEFIESVVAIIILDDDTNRRRSVAGYVLDYPATHFDCDCRHHGLYLLRGYRACNPGWTVFHCFIEKSSPAAHALHSYASFGITGLSSATPHASQCCGLSASPPPSAYGPCG